MRRLCGSLTSGLVALFAAPLAAQVTPGSGASSDLQHPRSATVGMEMGKSSTQPALPPSLAVPADSLSTQTTLKITRFKFEGNHVYSDAQLARVVAKWVGRMITTEDLEDARLALTRQYVDHGYINSGAILPDQTVGDGVVKFQIIEGRLSDVRLTFRDKNGNVQNKHLLRDRYLISRVRFGNSGALNITRLKDQLELIRQDPNIRTVNAELRPGAAPGQSLLEMQVQENNPYQVGLQFSNRRPPSVGEAALDLVASDRDLTGNGDLLAIRYDILSGELGDLRLSGAKDYSIDYVIPVSPSDTTIDVNYSRTDTIVVETPFEDLGITSESDTVAVTVRQPLYRRPIAEPGARAIELAAFVTGALRNDRTKILGEPFSFVPGEVNGTSHITVVRIGQELSTRSQQDAFTARSTFSVGLPWFDATPNGTNQAGGKFVSWLGQAQYVRLLPDKIGPLRTHAWQFVARAAGQLSDRKLLTLEQFAVGGVDTVRGYRENQLVRDQGVTGSLEMHIPLVRKQEVDVLTMVPFFDVGFAASHGQAPGSGDTIESVGVGLLWNPNSHVSGQLYYGIPLSSFTRTHRDAQDYGIHFNLTVLMF